jgi:hypothetical protein
MHSAALYRQLLGQLRSYTPDIFLVRFDFTHPARHAVATVDETRALKSAVQPDNGSARDSKPMSAA